MKRLALNLLSLLILVLLQIVECEPSPKELGMPREQIKTLHYDNIERNDDLDTLLPSMGRSIDDFAVTNLLLASDIDGSIHALNRETGELIWTLAGQKPLVQTSVGEASLQEDDLTWMVEPYNDGSLYFFNAKLGLQKLSTSIKNLVLQSPFALNGDDKVYTGVRKTSLYRVNARSGEIVGSFGLKNEDHELTAVLEATTDQLTSQDNEEENDGVRDKGETSPIILLGKTVYELTIHSANNSLWNVTYTSWGPNNLDSDLVVQNRDSIDGVYVAPFHDSSLLAIDSNSKIAKWVSNLPSVAVNVFDIFQDLTTSDFLLLPHPLHPPPSHTQDDPQQQQQQQQQDTFIDRTKNGSWFAMSDVNYPSLVKSAPVAKYCINERWRAPQFFEDGELLYKAISGVHRNEYAGQGSFQLGKDTLIPSAVGGIIGGAGAGAGVGSDTRGKVAPPPPAGAEKSWLSLPTSDILSIDPPAHAHYSLKKVVLRLFENTITTVLFALLVVGLSRMGILPPLTQMLSKVGFFKRSNHAVELVDQLLKNDDNIETSINLIKRERASLGKETDLQNKIDHIKENNRITKKVTILEPDENFEEADHHAEHHAEQHAEQVAPQKKARKRGTRGGKKNKKNKEPAAVDPDDTESGVAAATGIAATTGVVVSSMPKNNNLVLSDVVLGYGSHGTVVYKGTFENRPVAIKRMLIDFYDVASHEVNLLQESDDHPNVIRYFCSQESDRFLYIALELCSATLEDVLDKPLQYPELRRRMMQTGVDVLRQIVQGVHHLHSLKIVHRDIKPQNILVVPPKRRITASKNNSNDKKQIDDDDDQGQKIRMLISDFGLCKKLEADQSSFRATTAHAAGTSGWRAPELLMEDADSTQQKDNTDTTTSDSNEVAVFDSISNRRLTRAIDIFSMGCVFYYVLTNGAHPFGDRYLREGNIIKGDYNLDLLELQADDPVETRDLITKMIHRDPAMRPDTVTILRHPFFWSYEKKLDFLLKVSDRFEVERRDPPSELLLYLESHATKVFSSKSGWYAKFDQEFLDNLGKYRKYDTHKMMDLLRALRNKYHHFNDLEESLAKKMSPVPEGFYHYYASKFPNLVMECYRVIESKLKDEDMFKSFF